jgi:hypothetical protein
MWKAFMVWYKNIRVKKVTQAVKALNDHLFLLQDVNNSHWITIHFIHKYSFLGITTCFIKHSRNVLSY